MLPSMVTQAAAGTGTVLQLVETVIKLPILVVKEALLPPHELLKTSTNEFEKLILVPVMALSLREFWVIINLLPVKGYACSWATSWS